jgi:LmbE family N-acetylglucosaminyl deacetylase
MKKKTVAIIVAHPDDETLWAGGTIMSHPAWEFFVVCLCRKSDPDRAPKFFKVLQILKADGQMGDLDDSPEQIPLNAELLHESIIKLLPYTYFDLIITHNPNGEYTRHIRHEETGKAVISLWKNGRLHANELWIFAYEDGNKEYYPRPLNSADINFPLSLKIWRKKYRIITEIYGFEKNSFEAMTTPKSESFWQFSNASEVIDFFN